MGRVLDENASRKLQNILARTASPFDGEALTAARLANDVLKKQGLTWPDLFASEDDPLKAEPHWRDLGEKASWRDMCAWAMSMPRYVTDWERGFLESLMRFAQPSQKQRETLVRIVENIERSLRYEQTQQQQ